MNVMAEKIEVKELIPITPNDLQSGQNNDQVNDEDQFNVFIQKVIYEFVSHLSENEISGETKKHFCVCVNSIIKAYEGKLHDVKVALNNVTRVFKTRNQLKNQEIKQLRSTIKKLRKQLESTCEECKKKMPTEDLSSLSLQDKTKPSETEVDGQAGENEEFYEEYAHATEMVENLNSKFPLMVDIRCPVAPCGLVALLCLFKRKKIHFCPTKFVLKYRKVTRHLPPSCTKILQNLKKLHLLARVYKCEQINEGEHDQVLKTAQDELRASEQEVGLLSYSTESYNHCVTLYTTREGDIEIHDAHLGIDYIEDLDQVRSLELIVLRCDDKGVPKIKKQWSDDCHIKLCKAEFGQLSEHVHNESISSLPSNTDIVTLDLA